MAVSRLTVGFTAERDVPLADSQHITTLPAESTAVVSAPSPHELSLAFPLHLFQLTTQFQLCPRQKTHVDVSEVQICNWSLRKKQAYHLHMKYLFATHTA